MGGSAAGAAWESAGLLERSEQVRVLRAALAAVTSSGRGRIVLLSGEAGIGKTALLRSFRGWAGDSVRVLWCACDPLFTPRPLGAVLDLAEAMGTGLAGHARPYEVAAALLRSLGTGGPAVVVVDDAHWADEATLDVIRMLGRRAETVPVLFVVSYRDDELGRSHLLRVALGDLPAGGQVIRVELDALSRYAVASLVSSLGPGGSRPEGLRADVADLHERTGGNPFFVTEVLAAGTGLIPRTVRDAVLARAARLGRAARDLLDAVAVVPGRAEVWLTEALVPSAIDSLDECLSSGVLVADRDWLAFRHEIARQVVAEAIPDVRRASLHRRVLGVLAGSPRGTLDPARLAHHAEACGDADAVLRFASLAADKAAEAGAHREAVRLYDQALRFAGTLAPGDRARLLERYAAEGYLAKGAEAAAALREALAIYAGSGDLLGQGRTLRQLSRQAGREGMHIEAMAAAREAVTVLEQVVPPDAELARAYAVLSSNYGITGTDTDDAEAIRWGTKAIALAGELGCTDALVYAMNNVGTVELRQGRPEGLAKLDRSRELAEQSGDDASAGRAHLHLAWVQVKARQWALADRYLDAGVVYLRDHGMEAWHDWLCVLRAESQLARGRWTDAAATASATLDVLPENFTPSRCMALLLVARVAARRGESGYWPLLDEALDLVKLGTTEQFLPMVAAARAEATWLEGGPEEKIAAEADRVAGLAPAPVVLYPAADELACWRWRAGLPPGDPDGLVAMTEPYRLEVSGDWAGAARWWQERDCPYEAALALAGSGDAEGLWRALDLLRSLGAQPAVAIVSKRLRALGEKGVPRGPRPVTAANPAGLTGREMEVLALLVAGLSNADIAARLVVSARTVDHHVAAIFRKLGVPSRGEATAQAVRLGFAG